MIDIYLCRRNILLGHHLTAKLEDFGFTQEIPSIVDGRSVITAAFVAKSLGYAPPKMDIAHVSCKSEMYYYGVVCINVCVYVTFNGMQKYNVQQHI